MATLAEGSRPGLPCPQPGEHQACAAARARRPRSTARSGQWHFKAAEARRPHLRELGQAVPGPRLPTLSPPPPPHPEQLLVQLTSSVCLRAQHGTSPAVRTQAQAGTQCPRPRPQPACPSPASDILLALGHLTHRPQSESTSSRSCWTVSMTNLYVNLCEWEGRRQRKDPAGLSTLRPTPTSSTVSGWAAPALGGAQQLCPPPAGP